MTNTQAFDKATFLKQFYPANPFADGVLMDALLIPIKVLATCYQADLALEKSELTERIVVTAGRTIVQLDYEWTERWLGRKALIHGYVHAKVHDNIIGLGLADKFREQILEIDDPQLHQDLIEADKALNFVPGVDLQSTASASVSPAG